MNPPIIVMGAIILFIGLWAEIDWYRKYKQFYFQYNGGGSLIFTGIGMMALVAGIFMAELPVDIYEPIEVIKHGGHR